VVLDGEPLDVGDGEVDLVGEFPVRAPQLGVSRLQVVWLARAGFVRLECCSGAAASGDSSLDCRL
jgi:hypothetical protein